jgi:hypothetical protein
MQFQKFTFFPIPHLFLFLSILSFSISFIHSISLPSSFSSLSPSLSLSLSLSFLSFRSLLIPHAAPSFLSFHPMPVFSLLVPTSKSRHHFPFSCTLLSSGTPEFPLVIDLPYSLLYLDSLILSFISYFSVSLSFSLSSTFIHLPFALNLSTSSLAYLFLW